MHSKHVLSPKQGAFVQSTQRFTLYSGAVGAGKTLALVYRALALAKPGTVGLLGSINYPMVADILLPCLQEVLSEFPDSRYRWQTNQGGSKNLIIDYRNRQPATIMIRNLQKEEFIRGKNLSWYCIDEATSGLKEAVFLQLNARLRLGDQQYGCIATNPDAIGHYLYKFFFECTEAERKDRSVIFAQTVDNKYLPPEYLADLQTRPESWRRRFVEGHWGTVEGIIYDEFDPDRHIADFEPNPDWQYYLAVDFGFTNPFACLLIGMDGDQNVYVVAERYKARVHIPEHAKWIKRNFMHKYNIIGGVADPADAGSKAMLQTMLGTRLRNGNKRVIQGIEKVNKYLAQDKIRIHSSCVNTIKEIQSYVWEETNDERNNKEQPHKWQDHAMDALRYFIATIADRRN